MHVMDLSGTWRAIVADEERRRTFATPGADDSERAGWLDIEVPGHWRANAGFAESDGPVLHRRRFETTAGAEPSERWWLVMDGVFYQGDVWLDGHYIGDTEGYFFAHSFEVTPHLAEPGEHVLAVEVTCSPQTDRRAKRNLTGSLQHASWIDPAWNPGGIWRPVRLESSGPLRIRHMRVRCVEATPQRATLAVRAVIDAAEATSGLLRSALRPADHPSDAGATEHEVVHALAAGENRVEWTISLDEPQLWWPHALGGQPLYDLSIEAHCAERDDGPSHRASVRTGLRTVALRDWVLSVNGERIFLKGTNIGPTDQALGAPSSDQVVADLLAAKELGLDMVRVHSHIARPELYQGADREGMLVWQDLPLQWGYSRGVRRQAVRQAREAVDLLAHHPAIAIWCGHNEPLGVDALHRNGATARSDRRRRILGQALPGWNRSILDRSIRRTLRSTDGTRPIVAHSGMLPALPDLSGGDSHLWFGWEYGEVDDLAARAVLWPRILRFVSEFGAQALPTEAGFCEPERWPYLDWQQLEETHGLARELMEAHVPSSEHETFDSWRAATQRYQAELLRRQIEALRRIKYRPTGGFAQFMLADAHPAISHSLYDHSRSPKEAVAAVAAACRPLIVVAGPLPDGTRASRAGGVEVHVVSDLRHDLTGAIVTARLVACEQAGATTLQEWRWQGDVGADACTHIATITLARPSGPGPRALELSLADAAGRALAENRYLLRGA